MKYKVVWILVGLVVGIFIAGLFNTKGSSSEKSVKVASREHEGTRLKLPIGVSYDQVMQYLENFFEMEETSLVNGYERRMGRSKVAALEIIGDKEDIVSATLLIGLPNDSPTHLIENSAILLRFLMNIFPEWEGASDWVMAAIRARENSQATRGNKLLRVVVVEAMGMMSFTVEHKDGKK